MAWYDADIQYTILPVCDNISVTYCTIVQESYNNMTFNKTNLNRATWWIVNPINLTKIWKMAIFKRSRLFQTIILCIQLFDPTPVRSRRVLQLYVELQPRAHHWGEAGGVQRDSPLKEVEKSKTWLRHHHVMSIIHHHHSFIIHSSSSSSSSCHIHHVMSIIHHHHSSIIHPSSSSSCHVHHPSSSFIHHSSIIIMSYPSSIIIIIIVSYPSCHIHYPSSSFIHHHHSSIIIIHPSSSFIHHHHHHHHHHVTSIMSCPSSIIIIHPSSSSTSSSSSSCHIHHSSLSSSCHIHHVISIIHHHHSSIIIIIIIIIIIMSYPSCHIHHQFHHQFHRHHQHQHQHPAPPPPPSNPTNILVLLKFARHLDLRYCGIQGEAQAALIASILQDGWVAIDASDGWKHMNPWLWTRDLLGMKYGTQLCGDYNI